MDWLYPHHRQWSVLLKTVHGYPGSFLEEFWHTIQAWGYHGFLPKTKLSSAQNQSSKKQGNDVCNYHAQLYEVLQSFSTAGPQLTNVSLPIGPNGRMHVDIIMRKLFVIQDMQEGNTLCGCCGTHGPGIQRHSCACNVDYVNLDNPDVKCSFLVANQVASIERNPNPALRKRLFSTSFKYRFRLCPDGRPRPWYLWRNSDWNHVCLLQGHDWNGDLLDSRQCAKKQIDSAGCACDSVSQIAPINDSTSKAQKLYLCSIYEYLNA